MTSTTTHTHETNLEFVRLWTASAHRIKAFVLSMVVHRGFADDILQEVAATAWEKFPDFDRSRDFIAWANGIARNKVLGYKEMHVSALNLTDELARRIEDQFTLDNLWMDAQIEFLQDCVQKLPQDEREIVELRYFYSLSVDAISQRKKLTISAVYKALQRTIDRLFDCVSFKVAKEARL